MYYGFDTSDENAAVGALLVYGIWRSRDTKRFKISPTVWGQVEQAVKSSSKRAMDLNDFIERLKPKLQCATIQPRWMWDGSGNTITMHADRSTGEIIQIEDKGRRVFWTQLLEDADHIVVLDRLYKRTSLIIALVRDRLEREKPLEARGLIKEEDIIDAEV
ncbi:hypothetical protein [Alicyclobacillus suci]|uniref:hypothetical protein n=1 Tax=Alicyclobacillus suci TaxID=2816080 RepID=UPI001A8D684D|nr:hypothetical protein [Alicyclobacillus suci]